RGFRRRLVVRARRDRQLPLGAADSDGSAVASARVQRGHDGVAAPAAQTEAGAATPYSRPSPAAAQTEALRAQYSRPSPAAAQTEALRAQYFLEYVRRRRYRFHRTPAGRYGRAARCPRGTAARARRRR